MENFEVIIKEDQKKTTPEEQFKMENDKFIEDYIKKNK